MKCFGGFLLKNSISALDFPKRYLYDLYGIFSFVTGSRFDCCKLRELKVQHELYLRKANVFQDELKRVFKEKDIDIVQRNGYPVEEHRIITEDGYILVVFRIPSGNITSNGTRRQPVIIQHGIQGSATFWVLQDRKSIGLFLVDQGYDVWLPNLRGSTPSTKHVSLSDRDPEYWDFGFILFLISYLKKA
nr:unnamed protein product [Callosobruchus analis]